MQKICFSLTTAQKARRGSYYPLHIPAVITATGRLRAPDQSLLKM